MKSFGELLSDYIHQTGVSDAVLARRLGVSRQTVFRWREGMTQRPRHREDVVRMAEMLRLSAPERDQLLLAAGFPPDQPPEAGEAGAEPRSVLSSPGAASRATGPPITAALCLPVYARFRAAVQRRRSIVLPLLMAGLLVGLGCATALWSLLSRTSGVPSLGTDGSVHPAASGETLILISPFVNYSGGQAGFNVAGRLRDALELEFEAVGLEDVRVELPDLAIEDEASALQLGDETRASLVVWGEYDSGRVIAVVTTVGGELPAESHQREWLVSSAGELSATINSDLPAEVRWLALYILGQSEFRADRLEEARASFERALAIQPQDPVAQAAVYYFLGLAESQLPVPNQSRVVALYSEALELRPELASALINRGVAYTLRRAPGDLQLAEADYQAALRLEPENPTALYNLALVEVKQDPQRLEETLELLGRAERQRPDFPGIQNGLCWYGSLAGNPEAALPHCDRSIQLDDSGLSNDSRGLTLALLGRPEEAILEFEAYLAKLLDQDPDAYQRYAPARLGWIEALQAGENPFDAQTLQALLSE
jgi:tetratricopeptide (TPR) repeat protein/transcriptional regulator with XRE-family HTH domain